MTTSRRGFPALCLAALLVLVRSQPNELTIYIPAGAQLTNSSVTIDFPAKAPVGDCNETKRVCGMVGEHRVTFTIPSGTNIPTDRTLVSVMGGGKGVMIAVNAHSSGEDILGMLAVKNNVVEKDGTFSVPFLITEINPKIAYRTDKQKTIILLNGPMANEPIEQQFASEDDGSERMFTLKIRPGNSATSTVSIVPIFLVSARLLAEMCL